MQGRRSQNPDLLPPLERNPRRRHIYPGSESKPYAMASHQEEEEIDEQNLDPMTLLQMQITKQGQHHD